MSYTVPKRAIAEIWPIEFYRLGRLSFLNPFASRTRRICTRSPARACNAGSKMRPWVIDWKPVAHAVFTNANLLFFVCLMLFYSKRFVPVRDVISVPGYGNLWESAVDDLLRFCSYTSIFKI
jgi:hypothetical protein